MQRAGNILGKAIQRRVKQSGKSQRRRVIVDWRAKELFVAIVEKFKEKLVMGALSSLNRNNSSIEIENKTAELHQKDISNFVEVNNLGWIMEFQPKERLRTYVSQFDILQPNILLCSET